MPRIFFECDPDKNTACSKRNCGQCKYTTHPAFAVDPNKITLVIEEDGTILEAIEKIKEVESNEE